MSTQNLANKGPPRKKCPNYPVCNGSDLNCKFIHPNKMCNSLPNCKYGQNCFSIHPICGQDGNCKTPGCIYTHMKQKPLPQQQRPQKEKQQPQQNKKKESTIDEIRSKLNEAKELVSKSDLTMQGLLEQISMKLSLLEKEIESEKKNLAATMSKNHTLQQQLNNTKAKNNKQHDNQNPNFGGHSQPMVNISFPANPISSSIPAATNPTSSGYPVLSPNYGTPPMPHIPMDVFQQKRLMETQITNSLSDLQKKQYDEMLRTNSFLQERLEKLQIENATLKKN